MAYSKFAGTEVEIGEMDHVLLKEEDCIGIMPGDITTLSPLSDRVVIKVRLTPTALPRLPHNKPNKQSPSRRACARRAWAVLRGRGLPVAREEADRARDSCVEWADWREAAGCLVSV